MIRCHSIITGLLAAGLLITSGCAIQYYDPDTQTEHLWGFGHMKMRIAPPVEGVQALVKGKEVIGASIGFGGADGHFLLGWNSYKQVQIVGESTSIRLEWPTSDPFDIRVGTCPPFLKDCKNDEINQNKGVKE